MTKIILLSVISILSISNSIIGAEKNSTPKDTIINYYKSLKTGDKELYKSTIHASDGYLKSMSAQVDLSKAFVDYVKVVLGKHSNDKSTEQYFGGMSKFEKAEERELKKKIEVDGDKAFFVGQNGPFDLKFIKVNGSWKYDHSVLEKKFGDIQIVAMEKAIPKIIEKINETSKLVKDTDINPRKANSGLSKSMQIIINQETKKLIMERKK